MQGIPSLDLPPAGLSETCGRTGLRDGRGLDGVLGVSFDGGRRAGDGGRCVEKSQNERGIVNEGV